MNIWDWPRYNPPGLLIGPLPHKRSRYGFAPNYSYPGVAERVSVEVDFVVDQERGWL